MLLLTVVFRWVDAWRTRGARLSWPPPRWPTRTQCGHRERAQARLRRRLLDALQQHDHHHSLHCHWLQWLDDDDDCSTRPKSSTRTGSLTQNATRHRPSPYCLRCCLPSSANGIKLEDGGKLWKLCYPTADRHANTIIIFLKILASSNTCELHYHDDIEGGSWTNLVAKDILE